MRPDLTALAVVLAALALTASRRPPATPRPGSIRLVRDGHTGRAERWTGAAWVPVP